MSRCVLVIFKPRAVAAPRRDLGVRTRVFESRVFPDSPTRASVSPPSRHPTETLQDLLRFLRRDASKDRPVACALHAWNVLEKDALPLILTYHTADHEALSLDAIKLLVFLTLPPDGDAANVIDQKRKARDALEAMFRFRDVRGDVFAVLFSRLAGPLDLHQYLPKEVVRWELFARRMSQGFLRR